MQVNAGLIEELSVLQRAAEYTNDIYRAKAYKTAIASLHRLDYDINKASLERFLAARTPGVGKGIRDKIIEYCRSGRIAGAADARRTIAAYAELSKVLGAGPATVTHWLESGITSVAALRRAVGAGTVTLTTMQKYGLLYYGDLAKRIPRAEVTTLGRYLKTRMLMIDPDVIFEIAGSYRRGAADSGDIDILVSKPWGYDDSLLRMFAASLGDDPNYIATVVVGRERLTFLYRSAGVVRQIDVLNVPFDSFYAALLYFTGSWEFNERMRGWAKAHQFRLNQRGLFRLVKGRPVLVPTSSEEEIFRIINYTYVAPHNRGS